MTKSQQITRVRCTWAANELNIPYHDEEWGVPVHDEHKWFEFLILEGAQAGLRWDTILRKRARYREVFDGFDPEKVARYDNKKVRELRRRSAKAKRLESAQASPGKNARIRRSQQRPPEAGIPVCRIDHLLRANAGHRNGQRSYRQLFPLPGT